MGIYAGQACCLLPQHTLLLQELETARRARNIERLSALYPRLIESKALQPEHTRQIAQALHAYLRRTSNDAVQVFSFVQRLVSDVRTGALPPHPYAHVHLLGIFKERRKYDEGYAFWKWLVQQDETFVSAAVYGAAIELMAYGRMVPLSELENCYADALKRFPGTFAEYHLSPDAVVPDRSQPVPMTDLPMMLLQGIMTARVLSHDWKNAYLALDTALRLLPARLPTRFFEVFMTHRPLAEAYTTYLVACRAGIVLDSSRVTSIIQQIRTAMTASSSLSDRLMMLRAIANAIYAYLEAGGHLDSIHVSAFLGSFGLLLPRRAEGDKYHEGEAMLRNAIVIAAHDTISTLMQTGMRPSPDHFTALIFLAGRLQVPDLLISSLRDVKSAHIDLGSVGNRTVMSSAGFLGKKEIIEDCWELIASRAEREGTQLSEADWVTMIKACQRTSHLGFVQRQLKIYDHTVSDHLRARIARFMVPEIWPEPRSDEQPITLVDSMALELEMEALRKQVNNIAAVVMAGQPLDLRKTPFYISLDSERPPLGQPSDLRAVYDEYTVDPHQPPAVEQSPASVALSPTGLPLDELRFQNWVSVAEMMDHADFHEARVDSYREKIQDLKLRNQLIRNGIPRRGDDHAAALPLPLGLLRQRIKQLRSPTTETSQNPGSQRLSRSPLTAIMSSKRSRFGNQLTSERPVSGISRSSLIDEGYILKRLAISNIDSLKESIRHGKEPHHSSSPASIPTHES